MQKVCTYILFTLIIAGNTGLNQLFKLHNLFEHYSEHQQLDKSLTLMDFLSMHYWGKDLPDHDDEKDNQLPFKKSVINIHFYYHTPVKHFLLLKPESPDEVVNYLPDAFMLPEAYLHSLFKPPRIHNQS
jgi:hypothetical protein